MEPSRASFESCVEDYVPNDSVRTRGPLLLDEEDRARFMALCLPVDDCGCITWNGRINKRGYGRFQPASRRGVVPAHHVAWVLAGHERPADVDLVVDHLCQNPLCMAVPHLEWVTALENQRRIDLRRLRCRRGIHDWHNQVAFFPFESRSRTCFACEANPPGRRPRSIRRKSDRLLRCTRGHDVTGDNGYDVPGLRGMRGCRLCTQAWA